MSTFLNSLFLVASECQSVYCIFDFTLVIFSQSTEQLLYSNNLSIKRAISTLRHIQQDFITGCKTFYVIHLSKANNLFSKSCTRNPVLKKFQKQPENEVLLDIKCLYTAPMCSNLKASRPIMNSLETSISLQCISYSLLCCSKQSPFLSSRQNINRSLPE